FAESVGSCTDLVATVVKPFATSKYRSKAVISVFADAYLMHSIMNGSSCFIEESVQYIYHKQLQESDVIVINKTDLLSKDELMYVKQMTESTYPVKEIIYMNAFDEKDVQHWIELLHKFNIPDQRQSLEVDYDTYGAGEAMLA